MEEILPNGCEKKPPMRPLLLGLVAALGGCCNGLLGSGGGMFLWFALSKFTPCRPKEVFAVGAGCVLFFSLASALVYLMSGQIGREAFSPALIPAALGGILGAFLLERIGNSFLRGLFALVLVVSGMILFFR